MDVKIIKEYGYDESALGFSLSYNSDSKRAKELFPQKAFISLGENKFLESIYVWIDVTAPRYWWSQADTYRMTTKQSESTMHTILSQQITLDNFESCAYVQEDLERVVERITQIKQDSNISNMEKRTFIKKILPESFLQRRIWVMNYKSLQNVVNQRYNHPLPEWRLFVEKIREQLDHPEFIFPLDF